MEYDPNVIVPTAVARKTILGPQRKQQMQSLVQSQPQSKRIRGSLTFKHGFVTQPRNSLFSAKKMRLF